MTDLPETDYETWGPTQQEPENLRLSDDEDAIKRAVDSAGVVRFYRVTDYGNGRGEQIPQVLTRGLDLPPRVVFEIWDALCAFSSPREDRAYKDGRRFGREEIRGVLRDLVGPETARNTSK